MGFIGFYSSAGKNGTNGIGMGYNAGATSWDSVGPCFYVNGNNVMINLGGLALFNYGSGSPNGTVNATTGQILWDTTNSKLWVCTGGTSWKGVALT
jgi:hypothetical protein